MSNAEMLAPYCTSSGEKNSIIQNISCKLKTCYQVKMLPMYGFPLCLFFV